MKKYFDEVSLANPNLSSYMCFAQVVSGHIFTQSQIRKGFNRLVDKEDYARSEKQQILNHIQKIAKKGAEE